MSTFQSVGLAEFPRLLADLVAQNSISSPEPEWDHANQSVIELLSEWFKGLGFKVDIVPVSEQSGKYNLIATLGEGDQGLVLAGHTDTVPYDQQRWATDPFKLTYQKGNFYGLGTCDMKGFFPIIVEALRGLAGGKLKQPLIILATADEESSMAGARAIAREGTLKARAAVIGEPTSIRPVRMHKGIMMESIRVTGRSGHSSNPALGNNAMEGMHTFVGELLAYRQQLQQRYKNREFAISQPTLNLGHIHGGDSPNRICAHCALSFDLRPLPGMCIGDLQNDIKAIAARVGLDRGLDIVHSSLVEPVPAFETPSSSELVSVCERLTESSAESVAFATEAPFISNMGIETLVMGAGSIDQAHQPNEYLADQQVERMTQVLKQLIRHYCL
jgi:acetylornithine deacetylase